MHGSRNLQLPIQTENLAAIYHNAGELSLELTRNEYILELTNFTRRALMENQDIASKALTYPKAQMKKQHDKQLTAGGLKQKIFEEGAHRKNTYQKRRGGRPMKIAQSLSSGQSKSFKLQNLRE
ncbi:hypothetical protein LOD99_7130 [Oopsacas minuta]|uniref:Uncharacterized protein n=1 Tax=Oopsacas minuta TaxID=111878 RepID=A0AAV7JJ80_9METZ|nr:hypothetical protein LOD99_7130 [Oopsacas minuta]